MHVDGFNTFSDFCILNLFIINIVSATLYFHGLLQATDKLNYFVCGKYN